MSTKEDRELLAVAIEILGNCAIGKASRHCYADGKASFAGCDVSKEQVESLRRAVHGLTGVDHFPDQTRTPNPLPRGGHSG